MLRHLGKRNEEGCAVGDDLYGGVVCIAVANGNACGGRQLLKEFCGLGGVDIGVLGDDEECRLLEGGTFISARRLRMARIAVISASICFSSAGKDRASLALGQSVTMMDSPTWGRVCQISSVMKGR